MLNKYVKTEEHTVVDKHVVEAKRFCDICGKEITGHYWEVTTHHDDWGNDSIDSYEYDDCCSTNCLRVAFFNYLDQSNYEGNSKQFSVEHINQPITDEHLKYNPELNCDYVRYVEVEKDE